MVRIVEQWGYWCVYKFVHSLNSAPRYHSQEISCLSLYPREALPSVLKYTGFCSDFFFMVIQELK